MKNLMLRILVLATWTCLITTHSYAGGGWIKDKGTGYYKLSQAWVSSEGYFSGANGFSPELNSTLLTTSFYMEHGLGHGVSLELYSPFYTRHSVEGVIQVDSVDLSIDDGVGGFGDTDIGLRFQVYKSDLLNISGTLKLGLPTGGTAKGDRENLFTGDGEFNQLIRVDASLPFGNKKVGGFLNTYGGFNNRQEPFSDELHYGIEVGISTAQSRLWLIGRIAGLSAGTGNTTEFTNGFTQSMSYTNYMVETAFYMDDNLGFSVSYTGSIDGNVLLVASVYNAGIFLDIK